MDKHAVIAVLRAHEAELKALGVRHAGLFGSVARGENGPKSDIDIAIDVSEAALPDVYAYVGLKRQIAELFEGEVDVVNTAYLKPGVSASARADMIYAF